MNKLMTMLDNGWIKINNRFYTKRWYVRLDYWLNTRLTTPIRNLWLNTAESIEGSGSFWCWTLGHRWELATPTTPQSIQPDYLYCARCGMPENWPVRDGLFLLVRLDHWIFNHPRVYILYFRQWLGRHVLGFCCVCGKLELVLGFVVGDHEACDPLPF